MFLSLTVKLLKSDLSIFFIVDSFKQVRDSRNTEMLVWSGARRALLKQKKNLNKNLIFEVGKFSTIQTQAQSLFTNAYHNHKEPRDIQGKTKVEEKIKTQVFEMFESEGLRSVFNDEILTAVSISSSNEDLLKSGVLIGLYTVLLIIQPL